MTSVIVSVAQAWAEKAVELSDWAMRRVVNRTDVWGGYWNIEDREKLGKTTTRPSQAKRGKVLLTNAVLEQHFRATMPIHVVGLHTTSQTNTSRWGAVEIDMHGYPGEAPEKNLAAVMAFYARSRGLGLNPLLTDSDGKGGFHLELFFSESVPTPRVFAFMRELVSGWKEIGLWKRPETFPKQPQVTAKRPYGNWLRLVGRHHTREHWSRVWDGVRWLEGSDAVTFILAITGDSPGMVPWAPGLLPVESTVDSGEETYELEEAIEQVELNEYAECTPAENRNMALLALHALSLSRSDNYDDWLHVGMALHSVSNDLLASWDTWSQLSSKYKTGECAAKWTTFTGGGSGSLTIASLCGWADDDSPGWRPPPSPEAINASRPGDNSLNGQLLRENMASLFAEEREPDTPIIEVGPRQDKTAIEAGLSLLAADKSIFVRSGLFVHLDRYRVSESGKNIIDRRGEAPTVITHTTTALLGAKLDGLAKWWLRRKSKGGKTYKQATVVPQRIIKAISEWPHKYSYGVRVLESLTTAPTMRPDGKIIQERGYDPTFGIMYMPCFDYPSVDEWPTKADAVKCVNAILDLICDFPFLEVHHRTAWLSLFLTLAARSAISGEVPLFAISSNQPGTGKDLAADSAHLAVLGRRLPVMGWPDREEERDKRMLIVAMNGDPAILLGNINKPLGGETLEMALTAASYKGRILGSSAHVDTPLNAVFIATGNNLTYTSDGMNRRVVPITMYYPDADPELRSGFKYADLRQVVRERHPVLVTLGLTILRAFHVAGRPRSGLPAVGGFEPWCNLIREAILWLGLPDPCAGRNEVKQSRDAVTVSFVDFLRLLDTGRFYPIGQQSTSIQDLRECVESGLKLSIPDKDCRSMHDALTGLVAGSKDFLPNASALGYLFRKMRGRVFDAKRLENDNQLNHDNIARWRVEKC